jgi:hypothetical protein
VSRKVTVTSTVRVSFRIATAVRKSVAGMFIFSVKDGVAGAAGMDFSFVTAGCPGLEF